MNSLLKNPRRASVIGCPSPVPPMAFHEIANLFPLMAESELSDLAVDIKTNGQREPILTFEGKILDGRNRFLACELVGVKPRLEAFANGSPMAMVISLNLKRRHLTDSQKACVATEALPWLEKEAKDRKVAAGKQTGRGHRKVCPKIDEPFPDRSDTQAGKLLGVSRSYVAAAKAFKTKAPDLFEQVKRGEKSLSQARRERNEQQRESRRAANRVKVSTAPSLEKNSAKFATILIDPPWDCADEGDKDPLGRGRPDYATMTLDELLQLPMEQLSDTDCHLFCWITNRSLPKGFGLLEHWGFRYVTALTWPKPSFGLGSYFRGQTEHILFGVKGSQHLMRKDASTLLPAWKRGPNGHSSKPVEIHEFIESCSPGPYLEMFSRTKRVDWMTWGESL